MRKKLSLSIICSLAWTLGLAAQEPDVEVNSYTPGQQQRSAVTALDDGFAVVWESTSFPGAGDAYSVVMRRLDSLGIPVGSDFLVHETTAGLQNQASVASLDEQGFIVVWNDLSPGGVRRTLGRRFDVNAEPLGGELELVTDPQTVTHAVAAPGNDSFILTWRDFSTPNEAIMLRRFSSDGDPIGAAARADTAGGDARSKPDIATWPDGSFVVAWFDLGQQRIRARRFDASGVASGAQFELGEALSGSPTIATVADGSFLVAWDDFQEFGAASNWDIFARRVDSTGLPQGQPFKVNSLSQGGQYLPEIANTGDGFAVVWMSGGSEGTDSSLRSVQFQRLGSDAEPIGTSFQINSYTTSFQQSPSLAVGDTGRLVVTWSSNGSDGPDPSWSIQSRSSFRQIFDDGFETGDITRWSDLFP